MYKSPTVAFLTQMKAAVALLLIYGKSHNCPINVLPTSNQNQPEIGASTPPPPPPTMMRQQKHTRFILCLSPFLSTVLMGPMTRGCSGPVLARGTGAPVGVDCKSRLGSLPVH